MSFDVVILSLTITSPLVFIVILHATMIHYPTIMHLMMKLGRVSRIPPSSKLMG